MGLLIGIGLIILAAAAVGAAMRTGIAHPETTRVPARPDFRARDPRRIIRLDEPSIDSRVALETVRGDGTVTVRVTGGLDDRAALELGEYLSSLVGQGFDRLIVDAQKARPIPRVVDSLAGVAFALEQRGARLALVGRRGEMLAALVTLRANGLAGAIYVFESVEEARRGVGHTRA